MIRTAHICLIVHISLVDVVFAAFDTRTEHWVERPDRAMLKRYCWLLALVFALPIASQTQAASGRRVALVIGNAADQNAVTLTNPDNDAPGRAATFTKLGFEVLKGTDLDKGAMDKIIRTFAEKLSGADVGVFFYAGHGLPYEQQNYLAPIDAKLSAPSALDFEMVRLDLVQRTMERE